MNRHNGSNTWVYLFGILLVIAILFLAKPCFAQSYGIADFSRNDCFTKENLVDMWFPLSPGVRGDDTQGLGDFETWTGVAGTCGDCPTSWTCTCTNTGSIQDEALIVYKTNTSMEMFDGTGNATAYYEYTLLANTSYQITWKHKGNVGGQEDFEFRVRNAAGNDNYNFVTALWQAGDAPVTLTNITLAWTSMTLHIATGVAAKTDYRFDFATTSAGDTIYIDDFKIQPLYTAGINGRRTNVLAIPAGGYPTFNNNPETLPRTGFGPTGNWGMSLDGAGDYVERTEDNTFDPTVECEAQAGSFTVWCRGVLPHTIAAGTYFLPNKWDGNNVDIGWGLYQATAALTFGISDDGTAGAGNLTTVSTAGAFGANQVTNFCATYSFDGDAVSDMNLYANALAVSNSAIANGPVNNSAEDLVIGARSDDKTLFFDGVVTQCGFHCGAFSAAQASKVINPYFKGTSYNNQDGFYASSCTQVASAATCSWDKCRDGSPTACQADGSGFMPVFDAYTELVQNNSFETVVGDDSNPNFTNWTDYGVVGDGSFSVTAYRADTVHEDVALRFKTTGTTSRANADSDCIAVAGSTDYYITALTKKLDPTSTADYWVILVEHDNGVCSSAILSNTIYRGDISTVWGREVDGVVTTNVATQSVNLALVLYQSASDVIIDTVSVKAASYFVPWTENVAGAGTTTYTARNYQVHNPLSDYIESESSDAYLSGFCVSTWVWTSWTGVTGGGRYILYVPGTAGNNNRWEIRKTGSNNMAFYVYDNAGASKTAHLAATAANWSACSWKYIEVCTDNTGNVKGHWYNAANSTWYDMTSSAGAGTAIQDGQSTVMHIGAVNGATTIEGYIWRIALDPYNLAYPQTNFTDGPPQDPVIEGAICAG